MIDVHCHLNFKSFESDFDEVIKQAQKAGVHTIINVGTQISSSQHAVDLAEKYDNLWAIVGIHPHHADKLNVIARSPMKSDDEAIPSNKKIAALPSVARNGKDWWLKELETIAKHPKVLGIGECGMDYFNYKSNGIVDPKLQKEVFIAQIELAHKLKLPLQIHSRNEKARIELLEILQENKSLLQRVPGMFHCMAGSIESLRKALNLGFYIGFDGNTTYPGMPPDEPELLKELVAYTPLDRIVLESDSPYLTPEPHRGQRNEPKYVIITGENIAKIKRVSFEKLADQTDLNVHKIFSKLKTQNAKLKNTTQK